MKPVMNHIKYINKHNPRRGH